MANILYTYNDQVYANITNLCNCRCTFCIRSHEDSVGDAETLWHKQDPSLEEIKAAIDIFDFSGYNELIYCGYGEPTCSLENLLASASYVKEKHNLTIRLNTNGLGNLHHKKNIVPQLASVIDSVSISLNAPTSDEYDQVTRPNFPNAFLGLLDFAQLCGKAIPNVKLTVVDVLPEDKIKASQTLADWLGITLRIRKYT